MPAIWDYVSSSRAGRYCNAYYKGTIKRVAAGFVSFVGTESSTGDTIVETSATGAADATASMVERLRVKAADGVLKLSAYGVGMLVADASGNVTSVGGIPSSTAVVHKAKATDQSVTSSIALVDDVDLQFPIGANEVWTAEIYIAVSNSVGGGYRATVKGPTGVAGQTFCILEGTNQCGHVPLDSTDANLLDFAPAATSNNIWMCVRARNGSTAGTINVRFAQHASDPTATKQLTDSYLEARRTA